LHPFASVIDHPPVAIDVMYSISVAVISWNYESTYLYHFIVNIAPPGSVVDDVTSDPFRYIVGVNTIVAGVLVVVGIVSTINWSVGDGVINYCKSDN